MRIRSISDAITNSSNETFITLRRPDPRNYEYSSTVELTWEDIVSSKNFLFDRDLMVYILEDRLLDHKLLQNPFPRGKESKPWDKAVYSGWTGNELDDLWALFVQLNKEDFEKLIGICYVYGREDSEYTDYDQWRSDNDDLGDISIMRAGRDCDFYY